MKPSNTSSAGLSRAEPPALLYEMIRSFVTMARTLNLSHAVEELASTRQTVRRHINQLEETFGEALFVIEDRQYQLTDFGLDILHDAESILGRGKLWFQGSIRRVGHLQLISRPIAEDWNFLQQQQPLSKVWTSSSLLVREAVRAWAMSGGMIEAPELAHVRDYLIIYRRGAEGWLCVELGDKSFYASWFGWATARSSIGRPLGQMPGGLDFGRLVEQAYVEVAATQGIRLDHVVTKMPRGEDNELFSIGYARLLMGGRFPDGSAALLAIVEPSQDLDVKGVDLSEIPPIPDGLAVKMPASEAKYEQPIRE